MSGKSFILRLSFFILAWFSIGVYLPAQAQTDSTQTQQPTRQRWLVETTDGTVLQGIFLGQNEAGIRLLTDIAGEVTIPMSKVKSFKVLDERNFKNGEYWFENPNATRYLFSPSAYSLRKGEAYFQNTYLVLNSFNYGVTDRFTIGAGFELISTFTGQPAFFITPKYTVPISEKVRAGAGLLYLNPSSFDSDFDGVGLGYGIVTYGNMDNNATLGVGYGFLGSSTDNHTVITFSGMGRIARKVALVTENWLVPNTSFKGIISYGIRTMGEKITVDLAFINNSEIAESIPIGIPYVDFVVKFGK